MFRYVLVCWVAFFPAVLATSAEVEELGAGFKFTEGPAFCPADGSVYFTDVPQHQIYRWDPASGELSLFLENTGAANGLYFADGQTLVMCAGGDRVLRARDIVSGESMVLADSFEGKKLNSPNDLWVAPDGGIYFTDPRYGRQRDDLEQDGEHVYYLSPDRTRLVRVADDLVRPNGIIGTPDGKQLIIADHGDKKAWRYSIQPDGTLADKALFAEQPSDGMAMDAAGRVYLTHDMLDVYSPAGELIESVALPERPTNVTVVGEDPLTLFVTTRKSVHLVTFE